MPDGSVNYNKTSDYLSLSGMSNDRIQINEQGKPEKSSIFTTKSGSVLIGKGKQYENENQLSHLLYLKAMEYDFGDDGIQACKQLIGKMKAKRRLTSKDIKFTQSTLNGIKKNPEEHKELQLLFEIIGNDPRLKKELQAKHPNKTIEYTSQKLDWLISKGVELQPTLDNIGTVASIVMGMKSLIEESDKCKREYSVYRAVSHHKLNNPLATHISQTLDKNHDSQAEKKAIGLTTDVVMTGISQTTGTGTISNSICQNLLHTQLIQDKLAQQLINSEVGDRVYNNLSDVISKPIKLASTSSHSDISGLPRIELEKGTQKYQYFEMDDTATIQAFLCYLGPGEVKDITQKKEAPMALIKCEEARLKLKAKLGSPPTENISKSNPLKSDQILKDLMLSSSNHLSGCLMDIKNGTYFKLKVNDPLYSKLSTISHEFEDNTLTKGLPSPLRLIMLAEGLIG